MPNETHSNFLNKTQHSEKKSFFLGFTDRPLRAVHFWSGWPSPPAATNSSPRTKQALEFIRPARFSSLFLRLPDRTSYPGPGWNPPAKPERSRDDATNPGGTNFTSQRRRLLYLYFFNSRKTFQTSKVTIHSGVTKNHGSNFTGGRARAELPGRQENSKFGQQFGPQTLERNAGRTRTDTTDDRSAFGFAFASIHGQTETVRKFACLLGCGHGERELRICQVGVCTFEAFV